MKFCKECYQLSNILGNPSASIANPLGKHIRCTIVPVIFEIKNNQKNYKPHVVKAAIALGEEFTPHNLVVLLRAMENKYSAEFPRFDAVVQEISKLLAAIDFYSSAVDNVKRHVEKLKDFPAII